MCKRRKIVEMIEGSKLTPTLSKKKCWKINGSIIQLIDTVICESYKWKAKAVEQKMFLPFN